jgi:hypothetical protein
MYRGGGGGARKFCCQLCGKGFHYRHHLDGHTFSVHGVDGGRRLTCQVCGRNFGRTDVLNRHMKTIHKIMVTSTGWQQIPPPDSPAAVSDSLKADQPSPQQSDSFLPPDIDAASDHLPNAPDFVSGSCNNEQMNMNSEHTDQGQAYTEHENIL